MRAQFAARNYGAGQFASGQNQFIATPLVVNLVPAHSHRWNMHPQLNYQAGSNIFCMPNVPTENNNQMMRSESEQAPIINLECRPMITPMNRRHTLPNPLTENDSRLVAPEIPFDQLLSASPLLPELPAEGQILGMPNLQAEHNHLESAHNGPDDNASLPVPIFENENDPLGISDQSAAIDRADVFDVQTEENGQGAADPLSDLYLFNIPNCPAEEFGDIFESHGFLDEALQSNQHEQSYLYPCF